MATETAKVTEAKKLYRVDVETTMRAPCYILAESAEDALRDAEELVSRTDWDWDYDTSYAASELPWVALHALEDYVPVWSGGPDGTDYFAKTLRTAAASQRRRGEMTTLQERLNDPDYLAPESDEELWTWALHVGKALAPVYVANNWRWTVHEENVHRFDVKEIPSAERIAASLYGAATRVLESGGPTSVSSGRLTVTRHQVEHAASGTFTVNAVLELPDLYDALLACGSSGDDA